MIRCALTPDQFAEASAELREKEGIDLTGTAGTIDKMGMEADWKYDGQQLTIEVKKHRPFFSIHSCESRIVESLHQRGLTAELLG